MKKPSKFLNRNFPFFCEFFFDRFWNVKKIFSKKMEKNPTDPTEVAEEVIKSCKRYGCKKKFKDSENIENCCSYHPGKPIFHDRVKGWSCCEKRAYDWEEFE
jgi:hypothetical protein